MRIINAALWGVLAAGVGLAMICGGCQSSAWQEGNYTGQGLQANYQQPGVPGVVIATHDDGSQTITPLPADPPRVAQPPPAVNYWTQPRAAVPQYQSPVVTTTVIPAQPGVVESYTVTPETKTGDKVAGSRVMTWAGEAPGTVVEKVVTQKQKDVHNPLPAVNLDKTGIHVASGGGSTEEQAGQSFWQRTWVWLSDMFKGWTMWLLVIGIGVAAFFILPIFLPVLKPLFSSIASAFSAAWTWITAEFGKLWTWLATFHKKAAAVTPPAAVVAPPAVVTQPPSAVIAPAVSVVAQPPSAMAAAPMNSILK
jgi:hypothetical protein